MLTKRPSILHSASKVALETMESRRLFSVTTWTQDSVSAFVDSDFAQVQFGSNGNPNGFATAISGEGETQETSACTTWDSNMSNGLDSSLRTVTFALNNKANGDESLKVGSGTTQTFNTGSSTDPVNSVEIRADVENAFMQMDWSNITVKFYSGTTLVETDTMPNIEASTMTSGTVQESGAILTPTASNVTGVTISASVRLQAAQGSYPLPTDIFGNIFVT